MTEKTETLEGLKRLLLAADKQASVIHDFVYAKPFDVKAASDAIWVLHGILRAHKRTNPPWCSICSAPHNFGEGDKCAAIREGK